MSSWFIHREPFSGFEDLSKVIEWVRNFDERNPPIICIFPGNAEHWFWALRYSISGEVGYTLWGDRGSGPVSIKGPSEPVGLPLRSLVDKYINSLFRQYREGNKFELNLRNLNEAGPLIGLFHITGVGVVGFGLVTDITLDAFRNFKYWREDGGHWVVRWRMRVLWIDDGIRGLLLNQDFRWQSEEQLIEELKKNIRREIKNKIPSRYNNCIADINLRSQVWSELRSILDSEGEAMIKFYNNLSQAQQPTKTEQISVPRPPEPKLSIDDIVRRVSNRLFMSEDLIRKFVNAVNFGNVLLVGPPGVGKTSLAIEVGSMLGGADNVMVKVANALWFRRDVIGGETMEGGSVKWKAGFVIHAYNKAAENQNNLVFLIIDELNRADADKAFGDFFTIFKSPNPEDWGIPAELIDEIRRYGNNTDPEAQKFIKYYSQYRDEPLRRIRIVGTMNVVDIRNLFLIGEALLRRFIVMEIKCPEGTRDVEGLLKKYGENIKEYWKVMTEFIDNMRGELKGRPCISPGALKISIQLLNKEFSQGIISNNANVDEVLKRFYDYLKSSMGILIGNDAKKLEKAYSRVRESMKNLISSGENKQI